MRNYGFYGDWTLNYLAEGQGRPPLLRDPRSAGVQVFYPAATGLQPATANPLEGVSDPYYREYDMKLPDFWRFKEWEYEFDRFVEQGSLPSLMLIELPRDHFGEFGGSLDGTDTPDEQMADNDYAFGLIVEKVARSPFADNTLIFVIEDDAQDGPDHVDTQRTDRLRDRSVRQAGRRRLEALRESQHAAHHRGHPEDRTDGSAGGAGRSHDRRVRQSQRNWTYTAIVPDILRQTGLPLPPIALAEPPAA